jgi:hypothetical protein
MREAGAIAHRVGRPRGGNQNPTSLPFAEAIQQAAWDLLAKSLDLPLWKLLGAERTRLPAYASGLDFHLDDDAFVDFFADAARRGFTAFKIKVGHADLSRDLHRLDLLKSAVGPEATVMVDANEAWTARQAIVALEEFRRASHAIYWLEDPILRDDFEGLKLLRASCGSTQINAGEYLDLSGKHFSRQAANITISHLSEITFVALVCAALAAGWLSDRIARRKPLVFGGGFIMALAVAAPLLAPNIEGILLYAGLIGLGYGAFMSVDLALMTQVLPESLGESTGRDLGILTTAINIPQILSPVFAAWLLSISGHDYRSLFIASAAFIVAGSLFVLPIRSVR